MVHRTDPEFINYRVSQDSNEVDDLNLSQGKFNFGFGLYNIMTNSWDEIPPEFGSYKALIWDVKNMNVPKSGKTKIGIHKCNKQLDFSWISDK